ncbi:MAG: hypothetical protein HYV59_11045 [Planctomycetes bacterium]|nr:hypothetical protein [Planctomycetota bacterium]
MRLPDTERAYISLLKIKDYLLSETHPIGKSKAKFFRSFGFNETNTNLLKQGLLSIVHTEDVQEEVLSLHGVKYIIDGLLQTPIGKTVRVRTIWIIDKGQSRPRFVTAYPIMKGDLGYD